MLRKDFKLAHLSLVFVVIYLVFVTFFLDKKSNQKNQVLCINSKVLA